MHACRAGPGAAAKQPGSSSNSMLCPLRLGSNRIAFFICMVSIALILVRSNVCMTLYSIMIEQRAKLRINCHPPPLTPSFLCLSLSLSVNKLARTPTLFYPSVGVCNLELVDSLHDQPSGCLLPQGTCLHKGPRRATEGIGCNWCQLGKHGLCVGFMCSGFMTLPTTK